MNNESKRDLHADLALCAAATPGPWTVCSNSGHDTLVDDYSEGTIVHGPYECPDIGNNEDARFIAAAREGWPHAIERALVAEAENAELRADILHSSRVLYETQRYIDELETEVKRQRELNDWAAKIIGHALDYNESLHYDPYGWIRKYHGVDAE